MKVQYLGDVSDYRKYALLRRFAQAGFKIGICWVMTDSDQSSDGQLRSYLDKPDVWRNFDPEVFDALGRIRHKPTLNDLYSLEASEIIPEAIYFNDMTPDGLTARNQWHAKAMNKLAGVDLVFFDPDNGFEISSCPKGRKRSNKFIFFDEVYDHYTAGCSVLVYQHFPRKPRDIFVRNLADQIRMKLPNSCVWAFETAHVVFMLAVRPEHHLMALNAEMVIHRQLTHHLMLRSHLKV